MDLGMPKQRGGGRRSFEARALIDKYFETGTLIISLLDDIKACTDPKERAALKLQLMPFRYPKLTAVDVLQISEDDELKDRERFEKIRQEMKEAMAIEVELEVEKRLKEIHEKTLQSIPSREGSRSQTESPTASTSDSQLSGEHSESQAHQPKTEVPLWSED